MGDGWGAGARRDGVGALADGVDMVSLPLTNKLVYLHLAGDFPYRLWASMDPCFLIFVNLRDRCRQLYLRQAQNVRRNLVAPSYHSSGVLCFWLRRNAASVGDQGRGLGPEGLPSIL